MAPLIAILCWLLERENKNKTISLSSCETLRTTQPTIVQNTIIIIELVNTPPKY
jgi:hypothetical protein